MNSGQWLIRLSFNFKLGFENKQVYKPIFPSFLFKKYINSYFSIYTLRV